MRALRRKDAFETGRRHGSVLALLLVLLLWPGASTAGDLEFYIGTTVPGTLVWLPAPVVDVELDIDYAPASAEGGGLYGLSEVELHVTGDLEISASGFVCQTFGCLYSPSPFTGGKLVTLSGADNLTGEFANGAHLVTVSISGTLGNVVIAQGHYVDAAGIGMGLGQIQQVEVSQLVTVPEPGPGLGLLFGAAVVGGLARHRSGRGRARAA